MVVDDAPAFFRLAEEEREQACGFVVLSFETEPAEDEGGIAR